MGVFYENISTPYLQSSCSYGTLLPIVSRHAVLNRLSLITASVYGSGGRTDVEAAIKGLLEILPNSFIAHSAQSAFRERDTTTIICDCGVVEVQFYDDNISVPFALHDAGLVSKVLELLARLVPPSKPAPGSIYAIGKGIDGLQLSKVGQIGTPIVPDNYIDSVIEQFKHVVLDLSKESPCGRLVVLSGEPGTGKTFMVRGLVEAATKNSTFVVVPPHMIHALGDPEFVNLLIDHKRDDRNDEMALTLILEDADSALVPRGTDNMHSISGLLNLSDGLLGRALDIRVIATTNAEIKQMDEALMRPGRLCQHITTSRFPVMEAQQLANKLAPGKIIITKPATLAEIYKWTSESFSPPPVKRKQSMGF